jgi:hypothetical protein
MLYDHAWGNPKEYDPKNTPPKAEAAGEQRIA